jgi:hypothetical protein
MEPDEEKKLILSVNTVFNDATEMLNYQSWVNALVERINYLVTNDFNRLVSILYRLDVDEKKLQQTLSHNPSVDAGIQIAEMIIERQLQKIRSRTKFKKDKEIPEDDKW